MTRTRRQVAIGISAAACWLCASAAIRAQDADSPCLENGDSSAELRRRPGVDSSDTQAVPCDPARMPPPKQDAWPAPTAVLDRWRLVEKLGRPVNLLDPYDASNPLKGDRPLIGSDVFLNLSATSNTLLEPRRIATSEQLAGPVGEVRTRSSDQVFFSQTASFDAVLYKGDTVFRPPDWAVRFTPAINYSATRSASGTASGGVAAVQALYYERHLRDLDAQYDFDSARIGIQPLISDFRGFLLSDQPLAARMFGTRSNNVFQYNLALFARLAKDRVRLNDVAQKIPNDQVLLANVYWQDLFKAGTTSEFVFAFNRNRAGFVPELLLQDGIVSGATLDARRAYDVAYFGYGLDGHFGRLNSTGMIYGLLGRESRGLLDAHSTQVRALLAAEELSMDFDWRRVRLSMLHASGDSDPHDRVAQGFDTLSSGALFAGADSSFFFHQRLAIAGGAFDLKSRDGLLPSLRPAGNSIESNFTNPGLNLLGVGLDLGLSPRWTLSLDANQLWFDKTASLDALLTQSDIPRRLGAEFVANGTWRPFATQNLILRLSGAQLLSGPGYRALYGPGNPYSVFALLIFNF